MSQSLRAHALPRTKHRHPAPRQDYYTKLVAPGQCYQRWLLWVKSKSLWCVGQLDMPCDMPSSSEVACECRNGF